MNNDAEKAAGAATYPKPTSDGFFFEDSNFELLGIESKQYENGHEVRRVKMSNGGIAIVRELTGKESGLDVQRLSGGDKEEAQFAMIALSTTINGTPITMEDVKEMRGKDFNKLRVAMGQINFL